MTEQEPDPPARTDTVRMYSDYVCPFCYLGRESLSRYRESRSAPLAVDWHPFDLRAGQRTPDGSIDAEADDGTDEDYYAKARENVERLAKKYDIEMSQTLATDVDSLSAQLVSLHVKESSPDAWAALDDALFAALWEHGRDVGDREVLADVAEGVDGIDATVVDDALADDDLRERLDDLFMAARRDGVTGVPTFAYDGYAARGAVPPEHLQRLIEGE